MALTIRTQEVKTCFLNVRLDNYISLLHTEPGTFRN